MERVSKGEKIDVMDLIINILKDLERDASNRIELMDEQILDLSRVVVDIEEAMKGLIEVSKDALRANSDTMRRYRLLRVMSCFEDVEEVGDGPG